MCNLVETFPHLHDNYEEFEETLRLAYFYVIFKNNCKGILLLFLNIYIYYNIYFYFKKAKTVTLGMSHWEETNEIIRKNRRIGCSMSGVV